MALRRERSLDGRRKALTAFRCFQQFARSKLRKDVAVLSRVYGLSVANAFAPP
jgi:hypothetical protein